MSTENYSNKVEAIKQLKAKSKKEGFELWKNQPIIRAIISTIPPMENRDMLDVLLQSCFEGGFEQGAGAVVGNFIESMLKVPRQ